MDKMADSNLVSEPGPSLSDSSTCSETSGPTPSSSVAEDNALQDYVESLLMLQYNKR